ncbi:DMT family transporter [Paenibacillus sinopodophylli]|uniref:DMT family transporter n=1 Tax=Paenibacillus sinopodophylli TaxID=1837342 RepID=UPI00110CA091|nr:DMT family transporter [Paenibacillus sinopodophylli]
MSLNPSAQRSAYIGLVAVTVLWGISYVLSAYLLKGFSPVFLSFLRIVLTGVLLLAISRAQPIQRPTRTEWLLLLASSFFFTLIQQPFYFLGLQYSSAANGSLIYAVAPLVTLLLEAVFFRVKLQGRKIGGALLGFGGVLIIVVSGQSARGVSIGDFYLLIAMLGFSISLLFIPRLSRRLSTLSMNLYSTFAGMGLMLPFALGEGVLGKLELSGEAMMWLLLAAASLINVCAGWWWTRGVAVVGAGTASLFNNVPPFIALLAGFLVLGDPIEGTQLIGGVVILAGVFLSSFTGNRKPAIEAESASG